MIDANDGVDSRQLRAGASTTAAPPTPSCRWSLPATAADQIDQRDADAGDQRRRPTPATTATRSCRQQPRPWSWPPTPPAAIPRTSAPSTRCATSCSPGRLPADMTRQIARPRAAAVTALLAVAALLGGRVGSARGGDVLPLLGVLARHRRRLVLLQPRRQPTSLPTEPSTGGASPSVRRRRRRSRLATRRRSPASADRPSAVDGSKRVGLVVDFGTASDAPDGESPPAHAARAWSSPSLTPTATTCSTAVVQMRTDAGLICGMDGYPATECGALVADPTSSRPATPRQRRGRIGIWPGRQPDGADPQVTAGAAEAPMVPTAWADCRRRRRRQERQGQEARRPSARTISRGKTAGDQLT